MISFVAAGSQRFCSSSLVLGPRPTSASRPKTRRAREARAAVVEARPPQAPARVMRPAVRDANLIVGGDRTEDLQAEVRAMARAVNASVYSPEDLAVQYGSRPIKVLRRTLEILTAAGSFGLKLFLDKRNGVFDQKKRKRAAELRRIFTRLGPTFVKLGQGLSTRPDICPPEYLEELAELQRELGLSLDSIFSSISPSPIAAASLGQVYKAQLTYSGQTVAVKVQRPGIEEAIGLDFYLIRGLGFFINKYVDIITSDVVALIDEFARRVYQELNYVQDPAGGQNARRFKKLYADREDILVPDIFWDYTSSKVLTMEWVDGVKLNEQDAIERQGIQCSLRQLLEYGYFHADPHPGNLLATPEGKLAFLDFGMMSETPEEARFAIIGHVVHMVNRDYEAMARDYYDLDFLSRDVDVSPIVPALRNFFDDALNYTVSELNFKTLVNVWVLFFIIPAYYALILRSLTVLEGLALYADPNFKVLAASYPYFAKRLLTDPNPYLRDALIELLFKDGRFRWNRLENLLVQGRKDRDFSANDALQPVLKLLLAQMAKSSEFYCMIGTVVDTYNSIPNVVRALIFSGNVTGPLTVNDSEIESLMALRDQVFRIWGFCDPLKILIRPFATYITGTQPWERVIGGITQRLAARLLQQVLRAPTTVSTSIS
ncbi:ABC1 family protein [Salix suchowensis]|nr:ABC1 family protein [Salix suchowensis]